MMKERGTIGEKKELELWLGLKTIKIEKGVEINTRLINFKLVFTHDRYKMLTF